MSSTVTGVPTFTETIPSATNTSSGNGNNASSNPLLFFVALGFGVLFTNLWIIVGVKYCFRYSQRNRRGGAPQFEEEVDLATLHPFVGINHPVQRRRREKKLLKIEDVNKRFPLMTYKAWRAQREREGLSAEGGIAHHATTTPEEQRSDSSPGSPTAVPDHAPEILESPLGPPAPPEESEKEKSDIPISVVPAEEPHILPSSSKQRDSTLSIDPDDEDDHHHHAIPAELLNQTGDNCAICIEPLEDDDQVRGLTCGHCYHQACIDPWLTQRRASCPLCKADYYIPPLPAEIVEQTQTGETANQANGNENSTERGPQAVTTEHWTPLFLRPFRPVGLSPNTSTYSPPAYPPPFARFDRHTPTTEQATDAETNSSVNTTRRFHLPRMPAFRNPFRQSRGNNDPNALERGEG